MHLSTRRRWWCHSRGCDVIAGVACGKVGDVVGGNESLIWQYLSDDVRLPVQLVWTIILNLNWTRRITKRTGGVVSNCLCAVDSKRSNSKLEGGKALWMVWRTISMATAKKDDLSKEGKQESSHAKSSLCFCILVLVVFVFAVWRKSESRISV